MKEINHEKVPVALYGNEKLKGEYEKGKCHGLELAEDKIKELAKREDQPKLSIPKKIAEELDELEFDWDMMVFQNISEGDYQELFDYIDRGNSPIIMTYLAGEALGVDFLEVEG